MLETSSSVLLIKYTIRVFPEARPASPHIVPGATYQKKVPDTVFAVVVANHGRSFGSLFE